MTRCTRIESRVDRVAANHFLQNPWIGDAVSSSSDRAARVKRVFCSRFRPLGERSEASLGVSRRAGFDDCMDSEREFAGGEFVKVNGPAMCLAAQPLATSMATRPAMSDVFPVLQAASTRKVWS